MRTICLTTSIFSLLLTACGTDDGPNPDDPDGGGAVIESALDDCLGEGGTLGEISDIDNNVVVAHGDIRSLALSSGGQIAVGSTDGAIKLWSILDPDDPLTTSNGVGYDAAFGEGTPVFEALGYAPDGAWIVGGNEVGEVSAWSATSGENLGSVQPSELPITSVAVDPSGERVAFSDTSFAGGVRVWNRSSGELSEPLQTELWAVNAVAFVPSTGALVLAGDWYGVPMVELRDAANPTLVVGSWMTEISEFTGTILDVAITADESRVVFAGLSFVGDVELASIGTEEASGRMEIGDHLASSLALTPAESYAITAGADGAVRVWDASSLATGVELPIAGLVGVRTDANTGQIVTAHADGHIRLIGCATE